MKYLQITLYVMLNLFVGGLCAITWSVYMELPQLKNDYTIAKNEFRAAAEGWKQYNQTLLNFMNSPQTQRSLGLLMRTGDDLNRTVKRVNVTLDGLNNLILHTDNNLNNVVLPNANSAIDKTASSVQKTFSDLQGPIKESEALIKSSTKLVEDFNKNTTDLANSWIATSDTANKTIQSFESTKITTDQILKNVEYDTKRMGDILDVTYNKMVKVKNWMVRILMETGGWAYRVFIKP